MSRPIAVCPHRLLNCSVLYVESAPQQGNGLCSQGPTGLGIHAPSNGTSTRPLPSGCQDLLGFLFPGRTPHVAGAASGAARSRTATRYGAARSPGANPQESVGLAERRSPGFERVTTAQTYDVTRKGGESLLQLHCCGVGGLRVNPHPAPAGSFGSRHGQIQTKRPGRQKSRPSARTPMEQIGGAE